jgi:hypothetical protein
MVVYWRTCPVSDVYGLAVGFIEVKAGNITASSLSPAQQEFRDLVQASLGGPASTQSTAQSRRCGHGFD